MVGRRHTVRPYHLEIEQKKEERRRQGDVRAYARTKRLNPKDNTEQRGGGTYNKSPHGLHNCTMCAITLHHFIFTFKGYWCNVATPLLFGFQGSR
jgi:hypothetical protein